MAVIPVVVDTNIWGNLALLLKRLNEMSKMSYRDLWTLSDSDSERLISDFRRIKIKNRERINGVINAYNRFREMIKSPDKYVIHVPSYVYNEAGRSVSSKMSFKDAIGNDSYLSTFKQLLDSLPLEKYINETILVKTKDFPDKSEQHFEREIIMKDFIRKQVTINKLIEHLKNIDERKKSDVRGRTKELKERMEDVKYKYKNWDDQMSKSSEIHDFHYESRTESLFSLYNKIQRYPNVDQIDFEHPCDVIADRLATKKEDLDFFDLQIFLYAKEKSAPLITLNTQAYQQINDPAFLGYLNDIKIMHPLINFDSLEDLKDSGDLSKIIERAITKDFEELDIGICQALDKKLDKAVIESESRELIDKAKPNYSPPGKKMEINISLGSVLKFLRIDEKRLKVSEAFIFGERADERIEVLKYVDEKYFNNQLTSEDFVKDTVRIDKRRENILKGEVLKLYLSENKQTKNYTEVFQAKPRSYLEIFLKNYRGKTLGNIIDLYRALVIEIHCSKTEIETALRKLETPPVEPMSLYQCPAEGVRKRETTKCLLSWEDIEKFNEEKLEIRDPHKVKIDSQKFIEYLKTVKDPQKNKQLVEFADQLLNLSEDHISGPKVAEVTHIINNNKVLNHFNKVHYISSALNYGFLAKNLLGDLLHGDIEGVAVNIGFIGGNLVFSKLAAVSFAKGTKYTLVGKLMLANSIKYASPFISRFLSPLIVLDIYNQIKALEAGEKDAIIRIMGYRIFLVIDAVEIGMSLLEIAGIIAEMSAVTGPIGMAIGAVVIIGTETYTVLRKVQKIEKVIYLMTGERWMIGAADFFTFGKLKFEVEHFDEMKEANNQLAQQSLEAIKKSKDIQRIVIPSAESEDGYNIEIAYKHSFTPYYSAPNFKWHRVRPDNPEGGRIFCAPEGDWETPPSGIMARCGSAIGVADVTIKKQNYTLFNLGNGDDIVHGFKDSPNIFRIGGGKKDMRGGDKNDVFIIDDVQFNRFPEGYVDGMGGSNVLDISGIGGSSEAVVILFLEEPVEARITQIINVTLHNSLDIRFVNIDSIMGREGETDYIYTNCSTKYVDGRGGSPHLPDQIHVAHTYKECNHDKVILLGPNTMLLNEAVTGKFSYFINDVHSDIRCTLKRTSSFKNVVIDPVRNRIDHKFFINGTLSDIVKLEFDHGKTDYNDVNIRLYFKDKNWKVNRLHLETVLGYGKNNGGMDNMAIYLKDNVELRYHHNGMYALLKSAKPASFLIWKYQPIAINFGISFFIYAEKEGSIIQISNDQKDNVLYNDPSYKTYLVGNKGNNSYVVISGEQNLQGPEPPKIPEIEIYTLGDLNHINTLDLHSLSQQIKQDLGKKLLMKHIFNSEKLVLYLYTFESHTVGADSYSNVTSITIRNLPPMAQWDTLCIRLHVILNNAPVILKCDQEYQNKMGNVIDFKNDVDNYNPSNYYTPLPLVFTDYEIIVLHREDVEPHTEIIIEQKLCQYRFLRLEDDLILTNGFDFKSPIYKPITVMIKNFYKDPSIFSTLKFKFSDRRMDLKEEENLKGAASLEDWYKKYENISNNIIGNPPRRIRRDLSTSKDPSNRKRWGEVEQTQSSSIFGTLLLTLSDVYHKSLNYFHDYYKSLVDPTFIQVINRHQNPTIDFLNEHKIAEKKILGSNTNIPLSNENKVSYTNLNSTLLLLDTLVRKLNDSKYKLSTVDHLLSPQEQIQKKMAEVTTKLGLDHNDIVRSIEKQHKRILDNLTDA